MKIALCITGSIAATEDLKLIHRLQKAGYDVECFMSESACELITPLSMEFASKHPVITKLSGYVEHVTRAQVDLILVAPASANTISKFANKIADTAITTLLLTASGYHTPILFVPSMHISMYTAIEDKIKQIQENYPEAHFINPVNADHKAKFPNINDIVLECQRLTSDHKLHGMNIIITAGATIEPVDAMRIVSNKSSGKMGVELAKEAYRQGANVTLICGSIHTHVPGVINRIDVETTNEMMCVIKNHLLESDIYISAAAISDFKIKGADTESKIPSDEDITVKFTKNPKILEEIKKINPSVYAVGFKAEAGITEDKLIKKAQKSMNQYHTDLMVANDILTEEAGPGSDKNEVYLINSEGYDKINLDTKDNIARAIIDKIYQTI